MRRLALWLITAASLAAQTDPRDIVRRSVQADDNSTRLARDYTFLERTVVREMDSKANVTKTEDNTREIQFVKGKRYRRLIQKDGKPLSPAEEKKEQAKLEKATRSNAGSSPEDEAKRRADRLKEIPEAFDFALLRTEKLNGQEAYVIKARPRPTYRGKLRSVYSKMEGTLWIARSDYHWIRFEADLLDNISFGLFIAKVNKGAHIEFEQTRVNDEIWLPKQLRVTASARLALKKVNAAQETTFSNYRKFQTESKIVSSAEIQPKDK